MRTGEYADRERADAVNRRWAVVRVILGQLQMIAAVATVVMVLVTGPSAWAIAGGAVCVLLVLLSVLLFRALKLHREGE